jgi:hypothetical protein
VLREHRAQSGKILLRPADGLMAGRLTLCDPATRVIRYQTPRTPAERCRFRWELACELGRLRYPEQPRLYAAMFLIALGFRQG